MIWVATFVENECSNKIDRFLSVTGGGQKVEKWSPTAMYKNWWILLLIVDNADLCSNPFGCDGVACDRRSGVLCGRAE